MSESMWQNPGDLAEYWYNYPFLKQNLAEKELFAISKFSENQPRFSVSRDHHFDVLMVDKRLRSAYLNLYNLNFYW